MGRILLVFVRRLWLPLLVLASFLGACVIVYPRLEHIRPLDAVVLGVLHPWHRL